MAEEKKINFDVNNGKVFYSDEISVIHNPMKVFLDFKCTTPRVDVRNNQFQPLVLEHNLIILDPFLAKQLLSILRDNLDNYEKQFGPIKQPEQLEKAKKEAQKHIKDANTTKSTKEMHPNYFG